MKLCWSIVAAQCAFDKSVHSDVCIKVLWRLPADYAVPQGSSNFLWHDMIWKMLMLCSHDWWIHTKHTHFIAIHTVFHLLLSSASFRYLLASRKMLKMFSGPPGHQSWSSCVGSPPRKWSPAEACVHQTTWQCGVSPSTWRESQRGGV